MTDQPSAQPRYWIFKETNANPLYKDPKPQQWFVDPDSGVKPSDVAYFWREEDSSYFVGWGKIISEPAAVSTILLEAAIEAALEHDFVVQISAYWFPSTPVTRGEMSEDPVLKPLSEQIRTQPRLFEINSEQVTAINRLIRARGYDAPVDPIIDTDDNQHKTQSDDEQATDTTLDQLLETFSGRLTGLSRAILELAGRFANQRKEHRDKITSSCIFFASTELGKRRAGPNGETASQFVYQWTNSFPELKHRSRYGEAFEAFLNPADLKRTGRRATLTSSTRKIIEIASALANIARKETPAPESAMIHARDLIGALLYRMANKPAMGATVRFTEMRLDLEVLRRDYFDKFLNHELNPDDDLDVWRRVLIDLTLPADRASRVPSWTKTSVPSIDADIPSLTDDLNIGPEVKGFANIIAARDVKTPLSIGIFGDWGSGKSTFMEQLQAEVNKIGEAVRNKPQAEETSFLGNIVQIKFNAWHYAEANLWASLVSHVFENLSFSEKEEKEQAEKRKQLVLGQLVSGLAEQRAAEADVTAKQVSYEDARTELESAKREQDDARLERLQWLTEGVWPLVRDFLLSDPQAQKAVTDARGVLGRKGLTEEELKRELEASRTTLGQAQLHLKSLLEDRNRGIKVLAIVALTIVVPLVLSFLVGWLTSSQTLKDVINGVMPVVTILGGAFTWWRSKRSTVQGWLQTLTDGEAQLDAMLDRAKSRYTANVERLNNLVAAKDAEITVAQQRLDTAKTAVAQTISTLKEMEPGRVLERFVQERAASTDYRKLLGVIALIRRDFKSLSDMMREQDNQDLRKAVAEILKKDDEQRKLEAQASAAKAAPELTNEAAAQPKLDTDVEPPAEPPKHRVDEALKEYRIDRIVLYIDDLDRCPPRQVVDVLQAIHLLLAFELFVVVVGVDARWVRHALRKRFPEMLSEDWDEGNAPKGGEERMAKTATPRDYVEKIFQVPFWLRPMDDDASRKLLEGLIPEKQLLRAGKTDGRKDVSGTGLPVEKDQQTIGGNGLGKSETESGKTGPDAALPTTVTGGITTPREQEQSQQSETHGDDDDEAPKKTRLVLKPENLLLDKKERDAMVALSRVIGRTPRTVKRFVNIYRIIKAGLNDEELEKFVGTGESDQYRAVLLLLSIAHGAPDVAPDFFIELKLQYERQRGNKEPDMGFTTFLGIGASRQHPIDSSLEEAWSALTTELERAIKELKDIPLSVLRKWLPVVVRYTFQLGRLSEQVADQDGNRPRVNQVRDQVA